MTITIIGTGFVGVVSAAVYAKLGHQVYGLDIDEAKISSLTQGLVPFYEPELENLIKTGISENKLKFTTSYQEAIPNSDLIIIAVGTPSNDNGTANLTYIEDVAGNLATYIKEDAIIGIKSTVPPGTNQLVNDLIAKHTNVSFHTVSLPEFLREGTAVHDTLHPDRVVIGATNPKIIQVLTDIHLPLTQNIIVTSPESAQMGKYSANAYLAQRITFINQIADLCEKNGANINEVINVIGKDSRIGSHYWYPGMGYGGSCFPKDVKELSAYAQSIDENDHLLIKIDQLNEARIEKKLDQFSKKIGGFENKTVAILGLSFKPNTNDMRYAPSLKVIPYLQAHQATVKAHDPQAIEEARKIFTNISFYEDPYEAVKDCDILILLIEWNEYAAMEIPKIAQFMNKAAWIIDTRNFYHPDIVKQNGLSYIGIGVV